MVGEGSICLRRDSVVLHCGFFDPHGTAVYQKEALRESVSTKCF